MRIIGASVTIAQTEKLVDRAGYGYCSRVYGLVNPDNATTSWSKTAILNSTYQDSANFTNGEKLRMNYAPGDFSDLHLVVQSSSTNRGDLQNDFETLPVLSGFVAGIPNSSEIALTFEFTVTIEYVPKPILYQMVERKSTTVSAQALQSGENAMGKQTSNFKLDEGYINAVTTLDNMSTNEFKNSIPPQLRTSHTINELSRYLKGG